jgi:hypothetical protein
MVNGKKRSLHKYRCLYGPESVSMKAETSENAGVHRGLRCSSQLCKVNFAGIANPNDEAETEAFRASEGMNASRIKV